MQKIAFFYKTDVLRKSDLRRSFYENYYEKLEHSRTSHSEKIHSERLPPVKACSVFAVRIVENLIKFTHSRSIKIIVMRQV